MQRISLMNLPSNLKKDVLFNQSLGIAYLSSYLKKEGYNNVDLYDFFDPKIKNAKSLEKILNKTKYLCLSVNIFNFKNSIEVIKKAKSLGIITIVGGPLPTSDPFRIMKLCPEIDIIVQGEGELTLSETIKKFELNKSLKKINGIIYRKGTKIIKNRSRKLVKNLDFFPFPDRSALKLNFGKKIQGFSKKRDGISIISSRGCPYKCGFCHVSTLSNYWRKRSASNVVDEIELLKEKFGTYSVDFVDDNFFVSKKHTVEIIEEMNNRGLNLKFRFTTRTDNLIKGKDCLSFFKKRGCRVIELGVESGCQSILDRFNKGTTVNENLKAIDLLNKKDIRFGLDFIFWDPWLTPLELKENSIFLKKIKRFKHVYFKNKLNPLLGTPLYNQLADRNELHGKYPFFEYNFRNKKIEKIYNTYTFFNEYNKDLIKSFIKNSKVTLKNKNNFQKILDNFFEDLFIKQIDFDTNKVKKLNKKLKDLINIRKNI